MHGDAHLNNTLLRRDVPEVAAFIDWEMCTIGDPLLDLGWILVCWPHDPDPINAGRELAALGGLPSRTELLDGLRRRRRQVRRAPGLVCRDGLLQAGDRHRGHLLALPGRAAHREAGERLHDSASRLIGLGVRVATGDNPFT